MPSNSSTDWFGIYLIISASSNFVLAHLLAFYKFFSFYMYCYMYVVMTSYWCYNDVKMSRDCLDWIHSYGMTHWLAGITHRRWVIGSWFIHYESYQTLFINKAQFLNYWSMFECLCTAKYQWFFDDWITNC